MPVSRTPILLIVLVTLASPAASWEGVEVIQARGSVWYLVSGEGSPIPGWCSWGHEETSGPVFHATNLDGEGNGGAGCGYPWLAHCDNDSMAYWGSWPSLVVGARNVLYEVSFSCSVDILLETRLEASRSVIGNLSTNEHSLTVIHPNGSSEEIFSSDPGPDQVQLDLPPGAYQVVLQVDASQSVDLGGQIEPYNGRIRVLWVDPDAVTVEASSWSGLKALYR